MPARLPATAPADKEITAGAQQQQEGCPAHACMPGAQVVTTTPAAFPHSLQSLTQWQPSRGAWPTCPDGSQELAEAADLSVALDGCTLPLHSQVLATGSRVLRTVLLSTGGATASSREVAGSGSGGGGRLDPQRQRQCSEPLRGTACRMSPSSSRYCTAR